MHKVLIFLLVINFIDIILMLIIERSLLDIYIPSYLIIALLLLSAIIVLRTGYQPAKFYLVGWFTLFIFIFLSETSLSDFNENYLLHLGIPLEALIFSFALGFKMKQAELEKEKNQQIAINQSKLASMGEMISNIAHQWRQPLTHLSYILMNLKTAYEKNRLSPEYFDKKSTEATDQIEFMSNTINDFSNFFKLSKQKEKFSLIQCIYESINLLKGSFDSHEIEVEFKYNNKIELNTFKGELQQVLFNLLNNAKDELINKEIQGAKILLEAYEEKGEVIIKVSDNALGIEKKNINKIFEPYFTTKEKGLGIGLYMSKTIIENNIKGRLEVENINCGAQFKITIFKQ